MARIRTIKPEYWSDEKLAVMPVQTRLLFLALISMADDCGRLVDSIPQVVAFVYPFRDEPDDFATASREIRESLAQLSEAGRILRGDTASGQRVIQITNWERHQKVDHPNVKAALPQIETPQRVRDIRESRAKRSRKPRENVARDSRLDLRPTTSTYDLRPVPDSLPADAEAAAPRTSWLTPYLEIWQSRVGAVSPKRAAAALADPRRQHGDAALLQGLAAYLDQPRDPDKPVKVEYFAEKAAVWVKLGAMPLVDPVTRALRPGA
jgi:hypothetical protein